ncbi:MAG: hypothetical protein LBT01_05485 [Spirochaetaceae bacterium]|jgi:hypothetical protein|nr:hypothetical protein [Spirochaetaceae bacterium]
MPLLNALSGAAARRGRAQQRARVGGDFPLFTYSQFTTNLEVHPKDKAVLDEDTMVVHDHNKVNYHKEYSFANAECNEHLLRDLAKVPQNLAHKWAEELAKLLTDGNDRRKELTAAGAAAFPPDERSRFFGEFERIMFDAYKQNDDAGTKYYADYLRRH